MIVLARSAVTGSPLMSHTTQGMPRAITAQALGQVCCLDTQCLGVVGAAFDHLYVVDLRELRIFFAAVSAARKNVASSRDEPALDMGCPLRSVFPVSLARGANPQ
jgi:hypothetical protein